MPIHLQSLLDYKNDNVVERYQNEFPNAVLSGKQALLELMKYIWLCKKHDDDIKRFPNKKNLIFHCVIHEEMTEIDNMWHTFLLFTKDYQQFCCDYLDGNFFHHDPLLRIEKPISKQEYEIELERYLSYIHDNLGMETLLTWFGHIE